MPTRTLKCAILVTLTSLAFVETASAYYDPRTGRFISRDPIGEPGAMLARGEVQGRAAGRAFIPRDGEELGGSNRYAYVFNAPTDDVDPLGELSLFQDSQPATQPGPPPPSVNNPCQTEQKCCTGIVYAEAGGAKGCQKALVCVMQTRIKLSTAPGWKNFSDNGGYCAIAESGEVAGVGNKRYTNSCNDWLCTEPAEQKANDNAADACKAGCDNDPTGGAQYWFTTCKAAEVNLGSKQFTGRNPNCRKIEIPGCSMCFVKCKTAPKK